jgi:hypothetical protein
VGTPFECIVLSLLGKCNIGGTRQLLDAASGCQVAAWLTLCKLWTNTLTKSREMSIYTGVAGIFPLPKEYAMSSIANTLNSINSSLLNEIQKEVSTSQVASSSSGGSSTTSVTSTTPTDSIDVSQVAQLFQQLQQLQSTDPTDFKQVTADAATQLLQAAQQATDPQQASFLTNLADKFQQASQSGNLSAFDNGASSNAAHGHHGGHHHHHGGSSTEDSTSTQDAPTPPLTSTQSSDAGTQNFNFGS